MSAEAIPFDPRKHLIKIRGNDYLTVAWRLVWFRDNSPNGVIETERIELTPDVAVFKATAIHVDESGDQEGRATGHASCTAREFGDYIEKAETSAIGRALAGLGFGTQFCDDFVLDIETGKEVEVPVQEEQGEELATKDQKATMSRLRNEAGMSPEQLAEIATDMFKAPSAMTMTVGQAEDIIAYLKDLIEVMD